MSMYEQGGGCLGLSDSSGDPILLPGSSFNGYIYKRLKNYLVELNTYVTESPGQLSHNQICALNNLIVLETILRCKLPIEQWGDLLVLWMEGGRFLSPKELDVDQFDIVAVMALLGNDFKNRMKDEWTKMEPGHRPIRTAEDASVAEGLLRVGKWWTHQVDIMKDHVARENLGLKFEDEQKKKAAGAGSG